MTTPRVSVVMPVYNTADHLREAIGSVRSQSYTDWELLIGDGGSSDGSLEIARSYAAADPERVVVVESPPRERSKPARNRNRVLRDARGELVAFLDSDDLWVPSKLQRTVEVMDAHPDVGLVYAYAEVVDEHGVPIPRGADVKQTGLLGRGEPGVMCDGYERMVKRQAHAQTSSVVARTQLVARLGGFDEELFPDGDTLLWTRIARSGPVFFVPEVLSFKRVRAGGLVVSVTKLDDAVFRAGYISRLARDASPPGELLVSAARDAATRFLHIPDVPARQRRAALLNALCRFITAFGPQEVARITFGLALSVMRDRSRASGRSRRRRGDEVRR